MKNLLLKIALQIAPDCSKTWKWPVMLPARGLGSSSSVIVAGVNWLTNWSNLRQIWLFWIGIDNVAQQFTAISLLQVRWRASFGDCSVPRVWFLAYIPNYELRTQGSRVVLHKKLSYKGSCCSSSIIMWRYSLVSRRYVTAGQAIGGPLPRALSSIEPLICDD